MIWSTSYHHVTILVHRSWLHLLFTVASVHRCQILLKLHCHMRSLALKPSTCPSLLQPVHQAKPHLDLLHLGHMTPCHVSLLRHHIFSCGLIFFVSHINIISPPKLSLNYQNQTRTFQSPPFLVIDDNSTKIWKLSFFKLALHTSVSC